MLTLERLRLPLLVTDARCECGAPVDHLGRHGGACLHSGRLQAESDGSRTHLGQSLQGSREPSFDSTLRDMHVAVPTDDDKAIEVLASRLPMQYNRHHFAQGHFFQRVATAKRRAHRRSGPDQRPGQTKRPSMRSW